MYTMRARAVCAHMKTDGAPQQDPVWSVKYVETAQETAQSDPCRGVVLFPRQYFQTATLTIYVFFVILHTRRIKS